MGMSKRWSLFCVAVMATFFAAGTARAGFPPPDQLGAAKALADQLVHWSAKLKTEYQAKWPADQDFLNRADRFANRCQHLVNIMNEALRKGENGRHTQSAHGEVRQTWGTLNAAPGASNIAKWKERSEINKLLDKLAIYYQ